MQGAREALLLVLSGTQANGGFISTCASMKTTPVGREGGESHLAVKFTHITPTHIA